MEKVLVLSVIALCAEIAFCGAITTSSNAEVASRIINRTAATTQREYVVSLQKLSESHLLTRGHRCGGVLVTLQHAVTAASCNYDEDNGVFTAINPVEYRVFSVSPVLTVDTFWDYSRPIIVVTVHPQYATRNPYVNDVAVILLSHAFPSRFSTPVSLPITDATVTEQHSCNVAGWRVQNDISPPIVQSMQFNKQISHPDNCQTQYAGQVDIVNNTMICANVVDQTEFAGCVGDIGNPLVCNGYLNGILILTNNCSVSAIPVVYTRISSYNTWIRSLTGIPDPSGASTFQPGIAVLAVIAIAQIIIANVSN